MKIIYQNFLNLAVLFLVLIIAFVYFTRTQKNARIVETKIDTLSARLESMNQLTKSVTDNLRQTLALIGTLSAHLENSGKQLEEMLNKAGNISAEDKRKINASLDEIRKTRISIEAERKRALQLIGDLNSTGYVSE